MECFLWKAICVTIPTAICRGTCLGICRGKTGNRIPRPINTYKWVGLVGVVVLLTCWGMCRGTSQCRNTSRGSCRSQFSAGALAAAEAGTLAAALGLPGHVPRRLYAALWMPEH